ncbi:haloacid dehalogenase type II [Celerinatantimonas sp. YJH-8]|uniref:haloacid dehalogenase type II n=1 Tax=Celerinatantimonas sp. YJH-8 TaxID=3228714 RepID=UPI0038C01CAE
MPCLNSDSDGCKTNHERSTDPHETVLDLSTLKPKFIDAFHHESALPLWFSLLLHTSTVCIATQIKTNFAKLSAVCLDSIAARLGIALTSQTRSSLLSAFAQLQPHTDIKPALAKLRSHGLKTVAFSNSSQELISTQIKNSGLTDYFDEIISVEATGSFKPDPNVYRFAAQRLEAPVHQLRLVATHDWDTHGALSAGLHAAYINRNGTPYNPFYKQPDISSTDMNEIVSQILNLPHHHR